MRRVRKAGDRTRLLVSLALLLLGGCGEDNVVGPGDGNGGPVDQGPLAVFDIALRPQAIQRASSLAGPLPNPQIAYYYLSAFHRGGDPGASFSWTVGDPSLGSIEPKTAELGRNAATVVLANDGRTPLGIGYEIAVTATSGSETSSFRKRFAVVEHSWMKHRRAVISNPNDPPPNLVLHPMVAPRAAGADEIYFVAFPNPNAVDVWSIDADIPYTREAQLPRLSFYLAPRCELSQPTCAPGTVDPQPDPPPQDLYPDLSPPGLARDEILFSSQMDVHFLARRQSRTPRTPFSIWVVKRPDPFNIDYAKVLTYDISFDSLGGTYFRAFDYVHPRWDPSPVAPQAAARIAFIADRGSGTNIWLADVIDRDSGCQSACTSDTLVITRQLTSMGGVGSFDWTGDGGSIYFISGNRGIHKVDVASGNVETLTFTHLDSLITDFAWVSVFHGQLAPTLLAFQASSENRVHLYLYEVETDTLLRLNPFGFPVSLNLFPRWHPTRKEIAYVSDYNVSRALGAADPGPVGNPDLFGQPRTLYPSVWTVRLE